DRTRACPQPASTPAEHPGQTIRPSTSRCSTTAGSPPTVTNDASVRHRTALPWNPARDDGRAVAHHNVLTVPPETNKDNHPVVVLSPSSPSPPPDYPHVLILSAVEHPPTGGRLGTVPGRAAAPERGARPVLPDPPADTDPRPT